MEDTAGYSNPSCEACSLYKNCNNPFMSPTSMVSRPSERERVILVLGEAPTRNEDIEGTHFPAEGAPGALIRKELKKYDLSSRVWFQHSIRCRTESGTLTSKVPVKLCKKFLLQDIEELRPEAILLLGNKALYSLTGREGITKRRRQVLYHFMADGTKIPMMAAYHPAYALYDMNNMPAFKSDIETFVKMVRGEVKDASQIEDELLGNFNQNATALEVIQFHNKAKKRGELIGCDAETNGLSPYVIGKNFRVTMLSFSNGKQTLIARLDNMSGKIEERDRKLLKACLDLLTDSSVKKVFHNGKYDMHAVWVRFRKEITGIVSDTLLLHALLHPINTSHSLEDLSMDLLGVTAYHVKTSAKAKGKDKEERWLRMAEDEDLVRRAGLDSACTLRLHNVLWKEAEKENEVFSSLNIPGYQVTEIYNKITMPCAYTLFEMERNGFPVDIEVAKELEKKYKEKIQIVSKKIKEMPRVKKYVEHLRGSYLVSPKALKTESLRLARAEKIEFNPAGPKQVAEILHMYYHIPKDLFNITSTKELSADAETFERIKSSKYYDKCRRFLNRIIKYRFLSKGYSTYIIGVLKRLSDDGCVHSTFRMDVARTGRLSGSAPNLQNVSKKHKDLRAMYVAPKGWKLLEADYSQIELRILAAESGDKVLISTFIEGRDLHDETARDVWKIPKDKKVSDEIRTAAKRTNFGIVYLISCYGLQKQIGGTEEECQERIDGVYKRLPKVKKWQNNTTRFAETRGRVYSLFGNWRDVKNASAKPKRGESDGWAAYKGAVRQAVNAPIQGAAGFTMFVSMNRVRREITRRGWEDVVKIVNTVHDSLILLIREDKVEEVAKFVKRILEKEPERWLGDSLRKVPIIVDMKMGDTWAAVEKLKV